MGGGGAAGGSGGIKGGWTTHTQEDEKRSRVFGGPVCGSGEIDAPDEEQFPCAAAAWRPMRDDACSAWDVLGMRAGRAAKHT